ncbi:MAG: CoA transferase [Rhodospirillaceae bacterium]|nr:CoA transferase [Rhodospirillaceae bacterium]
MTGPLSGICVVDITNVVAGPACATQLADQGANVIKVEPLEGDLIRKSAENGLPPMFISCNRGKRSIAIDLKRKEAGNVLWRLMERADVFVQNLRPGAMDRLGFGAEAVLAHNPRLVYCSISGFGETGPYAGKRVYDPLVQAMSGFADLQGEGVEPKMIRTVIADKTTAIYATQAVTAALFLRERTGEGQHVRVAMLDVMLSMLWPEGMGPFTIIADNGKLPPPSHDRIFKTIDGHITAGSVSDSEWQGLCRAVNRPDWFSDPNFATQALRGLNKEKRYSQMAEEFAKHKSADLIAELDKNDVPCAPVLRRSEIFEHPQVVNNAIVHELNQPGVGPIRQPRPAARFAASPAETPRPAPELGQHSREILVELGYADSEIRSLSTAGVVEGIGLENYSKGLSSSRR